MPGSAMSHANCLTRLKGPDNTSSKGSHDSGIEAGVPRRVYRIREGNLFPSGYERTTPPATRQVGGNAAGFS
jgi:hypothetical protein